MKYYKRIFFLIILISISIFNNTKVLLADDIEKFANKLFNHYEYDDKVKNYFKLFFASSSNDIKNSSQNSINNLKVTSNKKKSYIKIKSKNKLIYKFKSGHSIQMNPTDISEKIIYKTSKISYLEFKENSVFYGVNFDF